MKFFLGAIWLLAFVSSLGSSATDMFLQGSLDFRPSWTTSKGSLHTENEAALFLQIQKDISAGYVQEFQTNLYHATEGVGLEAKDGYLKGVFTINQYFEVEPRIILPTSLSERTAGLAAAVRPILKGRYAWDSGWVMELWESPVIPFYSKAGWEDGSDFIANRAFENRVEWIVQKNFFGERLTLRIPLIWQQINYRKYQENALHQDTGESLLWINPELIYALSENTAFGLAYYSDNFVGEENSFSRGIERGVTQFVFQESF